MLLLHVFLSDLFFKQFFVFVPFGSIFTIVSKIFKLQIHEMVKVLNEACFCNFWNVHTLYTEFWTCPYILMGRGGQPPTTLYFSGLLLFFHSVIKSLHSQAFNHVIRILLLSWVCSDPLHTQTDLYLKVLHPPFFNHLIMLLNERAT